MGGKASAEDGEFFVKIEGFEGRERFFVIV